MSIRPFHRTLPDPVSNLSFMHIMNDGFLASLPLLLPFIQRELGLGMGEVGFLSGALGSAGVVLALPSSAIAKRLGGYRVLAFAMALYALGFIGAGASAGLVPLAASFLVASVGFGLFHPIGFALVAHGSAAGDVGKKMGNFTAIGDFGRIGFAAAATSLAAVIGWRGAALAYGAAPLCLIALSLLLCRPRGRPDAQARDKAAPRPRGLRYSKDFLVAIVTGGLDALASSSLFAFIPFLFVFRGTPAALLGSLSGAFFVGNMLGKVLIGKVIDRLGCFRVFVASEMAMALLLVLLSGATSTAAMAALSILLGAVTKGTVPVINTMVTAAVPDRALYEKAFGIVSFASGVAGVLAPVALGLVAERFGIVSVFRLCAGLALLAVVPGAVLAVVRRRAR